MGRHDHPAHAAEPGDIVTVAELLEQAIQDGRALRLAWPHEDPDRQNLCDEEWPTGVLPRVEL